MARHSWEGLAVVPLAWLPALPDGEAKASVSAVRGTFAELGQQGRVGANPDAHSGRTGRIDPRPSLGKGRSGGNLGNLEFGQLRNSVSTTVIDLIDNIQKNRLRLKVQEVKVFFL